MAKSPIADPVLRARRNSLMNQLSTLRAKRRDLTAALDARENDHDILARFGETYQRRLASINRQMTRIETDIAAIDRGVRGEKEEE